MRELSLAETADVLRKLRELVETRLVLLGGQALNYWAEWYMSRGATELEEGAPYTSKDIDFYGGPNEARECAALLGGKAKLATLDDASPNTGVVCFRDSEGEEREIDFLRSSYGLKPGEVQKWKFVVEIDHEEELRFLVLHPVVLMKSRLMAAADLPGYDSEQKLHQLRAAIICAREFLREALDLGETRAVLKWNTRIFRLAQSREALLVYRRHGIDAFEAALEDERLPEKSLTEHFPRMRRVLAGRRAKAAR